MKYRLGVDVGVGSIGFAVVEMDQSGRPVRVADTGVRLFEPSTGAAERRGFRGARRHHQRKRKRLRRLWALLAERGLAKPIPEELQAKNAKETSFGKDTSKKRFFKKVLAKCPYRLRAEALERKLQPQELGFALYHMANHRGSSAVRTTGESEQEKKESGKMKEKMARARTLLKQHKTYGAMLYYERQNAAKYKRKAVRASDLVPGRQMILDEFKAIFEKQADWYPGILDEEYVRQLRECLDFEHEKLAPPPDDCPYVRGEKRLPRAHPLSERRRIVEAVNNVRFQTFSIHTATGEERDSSEWLTLDRAQRDALVNELSTSGKDLSESKALGLLGLKKAPKPRKTANPGFKPFGRVKLQGKDVKNPKIKKSFLPLLAAEPFWSDLNSEAQEEFTRDWNQIPDDRVLLGVLSEKYGIPKDEAQGVVERLDELPAGYAPIGRTASKTVLKYLEAEPGLSYTEALEHALDTGELLPSNANGRMSMLDRLPYYGRVLPETTQSVSAKPFHPKFKGKDVNEPRTAPDEKKCGRIANPVVHQALNELRKVVNCILKKHGKPEEIGIELARELHKSQEERDKINRDQLAFEKARLKRIAAYVKQFKVRPSEKQLVMLRLLEDQENTCVYCGERLSPSDIHNNLLDIDHVLPMSITMDNSYGNKVLAHRDCNLEKSNRAPFEAFAGDAKRWNIIQNLLNTLKVPAGKKRRFEEGALDSYMKDKGFLERYRIDTGYLSKTAKKYLGSLYSPEDALKKVNAVQGGVTAQLRTAWLINEALEELAVEGIQDPKMLQKIEEEFSRGRKVRLDHRHHAADALAVALSTRGYQKLTNDLARNTQLKHKNKRAWYHDIFKVPFGLEAGDFKQYVLEVLRNTPVSLKSKVRENGALHKQTLYSVCGVKDGKCTYCRKCNVDGFKDKSEAQKRLFPVEMNKSFNVFDQMDGMLEQNKRIWEELEKQEQNAPKILESDNAVRVESGHKVIKGTKSNLWAITVAETAKKYPKYYYFKQQNINTLNSLRDSTPFSHGVAIESGDNFCLDFFYNEKGVLCGEIISMEDGVRLGNGSNPFIPWYERHGLKLVERLFIGDVFEMDSYEFGKKYRPNSERVMARFSGMEKREGYYKGNFTQVRIHLAPLLHPGEGDSLKSKDGLNTLKKYNLRKVIINPIGDITYLSRILKDN